MLYYSHAVRNNSKAREGGVLMKDVEQIINEVLAKASELANRAGEDFVLAVTAAYMVGLEAGKQAAKPAE
jgi:hypothetical protein